MARFLVFLLLTVPVFAGHDSDTTSLHSRWHFVMGFSALDLSSSESIRSAYVSSQYSFVVIPKFLNPKIGLQRSITDRLRVEAELMTVLPVSYRASNWYKVVSQTRVAPTTRFDAYEKVSGFSGQMMAHLVLAPVRFGISRFEISINSGISISRLSSEVRHEYIFCQNKCSQDTSFTNSFSGTNVGGLLGLNFDFYWTRHISTQFRLIGRSTTSFSIKPVRYTYVTLDRQGQNPTPNERFVKGHSFNLSGVDFSLSLLFHL